MSKHFSKEDMFGSQVHTLSGKCKSKPQLAITSQMLGYLLPKIFTRDKFWFLCGGKGHVYYW